MILYCKKKAKLQENASKELVSLCDQSTGRGQQEERGKGVLRPQPIKKKKKKIDV